MGAQGRVFLEVPGVPCPATPAGVDGVFLEGAVLTAPEPVDLVNVRLWPVNINADIGGIATFVARSLELTLSSLPLPALGPGATPALAQGPVQGLTAAITGGLALVSAPSFGVDGSASQLPGIMATSGATAAIQQQPANANGIRFVLSGLSFPFQMQAEFSGIQATLNVVFAGTITADVLLGCAAPCGLRGTCSAVGAGTECMCDCGWTGPDCSVAAGFCPVPVSYLLPGNTSSVPVINAEPAAAPAAPTPAAPTCPAGVLLNPTTGACDGCAQGFRGQNCDLCASDAACATLRPDVSDAVCDASLVYGVNSERKMYSCDIAASSVAGLILPDFGFSCNTTSIASLAPVSVRPDGSGPFVDVTPLQGEDPANPRGGGFCSLDFAVTGSADKRIACLAWGCLFEDGSGRVECLRAQCECPSGCPSGIGGAVAGITGPVVADCNTVAGTCVLDIEGLPITLEMPCEASECVDPGYQSNTVGSGVFEKNDTTNWDVVISGIPLYLAILCCIVLAAATVPRILAVNRAVHAIRSRAALTIMGTTVTRAGGSKPAALSFSNISLDVHKPVSCFKQPAPLESKAVAVAEGTTEPAEPAYSTLARSDTADTTGMPAVLDRQGVHPSTTELVTVHAHSAALSQQKAGARSSGSGSGSSSAKWPPALTSRRQRGGDGAGKRHSILQGVSGQARAGEVLAVMGPSGSGKSTLLAVLSRQPRLLPSSAKAVGDVSLSWSSDAKADEAVRRAEDGAADPMQAGTPDSAPGVRLGFVQQHDSLLATLTVTETLLLGIMLREHVSSSDVPAVANRVAALLFELGLTACADRLVGGASGIRGVSGGEKRRTSIALELSAEPHVLILDEVTSGLDSYNAHQLLKVLKRIAVEHRRIVLMSIHQPSQAIFAMLDQLVLLADGAQVFSGPTARVDGFLASAGVPRPPDMPTADFLLEIVNEPSTLAQLRAHSAAAGGAGEPAGRLKWDVLVAKGQTSRATHQLGVLVWRGLLDMVRNPSMLLLTWGISLAFGAFCGLIFWDLDRDITGVQNRLGALFFALTFVGIFSITSIDSLMAERVVVRKEVGLGYYQSIMYVGSKCLLDALLMRIVPALLFGTPVYFMARFQAGAERFWLYMLVLAVYAICMQLQAMIVVEWASRAGNAMMVFVLMFIISFLFAGFLVNNDSIHPAVRWIKYVAVISYAYEALAVNEFQGNTFDFTVEGYANIANVDGEVFAEVIGINMDVLTRNIIILICWVAGLFLLLLLSARLRQILYRR